VQTKWFARAGVGVFLAIVAAVSVMETRSQPAAIDQPVRESIAAAEVDPLRAQLGRCQAIGEAGARDPACLRAWAENRRRFLAPGARPAASLREAGDGQGDAVGNSGAALTAADAGGR
jgi:conjugative transfer region protein TrbK